MTNSVKILDQEYPIDTKEINLSNRGLKKIPNGVFSLINLQKLDLQYNQIDEIDKKIAGLKNLKELNLFKNRITEIPENIDGLINLQKLYLDNNQLTFIPEGVANLLSLQELNLGANQLTSIPEAIGNLINLRILDVSKNQLTSIPEAIGNLTNLKDLFIYSNQTTEIPECIGNLINLESLYLSSNSLTAIPECIGNLINLQILYLSSNSLTVIPECIGNLINLEKLNLKNNQLKIIPGSISKLTRLRELDLSSNELRSLPRSMKRMTLLTILRLENNPDLQNFTDNGSLGRIDLIEIFRDRVVLDDVNPISIIVDEKELLKEIQHKPIHWNLNKLKNIKLKQVRKTVLNETRMIEIIEKASAIKLINQEDKDDIINYIKMLFNPDMDYKGWEMDDEYIPFTIDLLGNILEDLNEKLDSNRIDDLQYSMDSIAEGIRDCPDRQMAELRHAYSSMINELHEFIINRIAMLKNTLFEITVIPRRSLQNAYVLNYWEKKFDGLLGFDFDFKNRTKAMGEDPFNGNRGNVLKVFFDYFTPEYVINVLTDEINSKNELICSLMLEIENYTETSNDKKIEMGSSEYPVTKDAVEYVLLKMNILSKGKE